MKVAAVSRPTGIRPWTLCASVICEVLMAATIRLTVLMVYDATWVAKKLLFPSSEQKMSVRADSSAAYPSNLKIDARCPFKILLPKLNPKQYHITDIILLSILMMKERFCFHFQIMQSVCISSCYLTWLNSAPPYTSQRPMLLTHLFRKLRIVPIKRFLIATCNQRIWCKTDVNLK